MTPGSGLAAWGAGIGLVGAALLVPGLFGVRADAPESTPAAGLALVVPRVAPFAVALLALAVRQRGYRAGAWIAAGVAGAVGGLFGLTIATPVFFLAAGLLIAGGVQELSGSPDAAGSAATWGLVLGLVALASLVLPALVTRDACWERRAGVWREVPPPAEGLDPFSTTTSGSYSSDDPDGGFTRTCTSTAATPLGTALSLSLWVAAAGATAVVAARAPRREAA